MTDARDEAAVERPDDDDHDLLTFGEAGARLEIEIREVRKRIEQLRRDPSVDAAAVFAAERRLEDLLEGQRRNAAQPINDENFERFFGYRGMARRNTSW